MKQKAILILTILMFIAISSCDDEIPSPVGDIMGVLGYNDADIPDCLFRIGSVSMWTTADMIPGHNGKPYLYTETYCWAYLSNGIDFIDPTSITCNGSSMERLYKGQYEFWQKADNMSGHLTNINWHITELLGHTYTASDTNLPPLFITNMKYGDTLNKSQGINIQYEGYLGGNDSITIGISYFYYLGLNYEDVGHYSFRKKVPDNGSIILTEGDLASLPTSIAETRMAFGDIGLSRCKYVEENFNGRTFAKLYETSFSYDVYIK
jgi:hypothetical protein